VGWPGVAKFLAASGLARTMGLVFHRIRCTPDLTPEDVVAGADLTGAGATAGDNRCGLVFANVLLVDDLDRLPPKTTSVLHHALQDREVIISGQRGQLPNPFVLLATRYPADDAAELLYEPRNDRFMFEIRVRYPDYAAEYRTVENENGEADRPIRQVTSPAEILALQHYVRDIAIPPPVIHYAVRLIRSTRVHEGENPDFVYEWVSQGAGPRALQHLALAGKVRAALAGRSEVHSGDIRAMAHPALRHRLITNRNARGNGITADRVISRLLEELPERIAGDDQPAASGDVLDPLHWFPGEHL
jgi:MoxR-like ATPase